MKRPVVIVIDDVLHVPNSQGGKDNVIALKVACNVLNGRATYVVYSLRSPDPATASWLCMKQRGSGVLGGTTRDASASAPTLRRIRT